MDNLGIDPFHDSERVVTTTTAFPVRTMMHDFTIKSEVKEDEKGARTVLMRLEARELPPTVSAEFSVWLNRKEARALVEALLAALDALPDEGGDRWIDERCMRSATVTTGATPASRGGGD